MTNSLMSFEALAPPPHDSPSPHSEESYPMDDGFAGDDLDGSGSAEGDEPGSGKRRSRRPPSTAERRATHNAVERARRETLNGRFMELAAALPSMAQVKRPSKSIIVAKSLEYVYAAEGRENTLIAQNAALRREVDELRSRLGMPALPVAAPLPPASGAVLKPTTGAAPRRERSSISSASVVKVEQNVSPKMTSAKPAAAATPALGFSPSTTNLSLGSSAGSPPSSSDGASAMFGLPTNLAAFPVANGSSAAPNFPVLDLNYLMALSMQQQQQQADIAGMALPCGYSPTNNWASFGLNMNLPVSSGSEMPFVFA